MFELRESTLVDAMRRRGQDHPEGTAFVFLENGEQESVRLTAGEADARARVIAVSLQARASAGDRALLLYPSTSGSTSEPCGAADRQDDHHEDGVDDELGKLEADLAATLAELERLLEDRP